jgi:hypothetical protein
VRVQQRVTTRFTFEDGDTPQGIADAVRRSPYFNQPITVVEGGFEVTESLNPIQT